MMRPMISTAPGFKKLVLSTLVTAIVLFSFVSFANQAFPVGPNPQMTAGSLCQHPTEFRYKERIAYCQRDVDSSLKDQIIAEYDKRFGFHIQQMNRGDFKIDHLIPLSIGGSNNMDNLWPQHKSVYAVTDPIESVISQLMVDGKVTQKDAIQYVLAAKHDLSKAPEIYSHLQNLMRQH